MAGIYHNAELGIISMSSDGVNWLTIADKNLGATQVYDGGVMSEATSGKFYQWGNNHGFPYSDSFTTSRTKVDASTYGPGNYYDSDIFITSGEGDGDWSSVPNDNLRGGITGTVEAMQGPCSNGFHIPTKDEWSSVMHILAVDFDFEQNGETLKTYLKLPICGYRRSSDGMIQRTNNYGYYHTVTIYTSGKSSYFLMTNPSVATNNEYTYHTTGGSIRPFKNEAEIPYADEGWTKLYGGDLPPRPVPPEPKNYIKRFQNGGNYYYFGEPPVHASGVTLNKSGILLTEVGQTEQLVAIVTPEDAVEKSVTWTSSDTTIAKVYQDGTVECVTPGECTITCTVNDGGYTATCDVDNIKEAYVEYIVVGGGGGGGSMMHSGYDCMGGGGGGGGDVCAGCITLVGSTSITIGAGGASGCNGGDTTFGNIIAKGGCAGRTNYSASSSCKSGGDSGKGCIGGNLSNSVQCASSGGGGGGADGVGGNGTATRYSNWGCWQGGNGGLGKCGYGGGGGGGMPVATTCTTSYGGKGCCGGGDGGTYNNNNSNGCPATKYGGGGGGGGCYNSQGVGGAGCQGVVFVCYLTSCGYDVTGGCKYTCGDYTIHCFTSDGTLCVN